MDNQSLFMKEAFIMRNQPDLTPRPENLTYNPSHEQSKQEILRHMELSIKEARKESDQFRNNSKQTFYTSRIVRSLRE